MCFDHDSRPPIPPVAGGALDHKDLVLTAADGNRLAAFQARAAEPSGAGIVVLPDVRGLHPYYEELALRFAENGIDAVAIDYFGRTAGAAKRGPAFDHQPHVAQTRLDGLKADVTAAAEQLTANGRATSRFTIGFCFGGRLAFLTPTFGLGLAGAVGFYGWPVGPSRNNSPAPADVADQMRSPVLAIFGDADEGIGPDARATFEQALTTAHVEHEIVTYPGAPHSFFDRKSADFADASADAWRRTLEFIRACTPVT